MARKSVKGTEGNWIEMQDDTFTNWVNANLKQREMSVENLEFGFEDGTKLVNLFEIVSKRSVGRYAKNPKFPNQKLENVSIVLKAMENDGVKLVSIDSDHVVNCNSKMIMGLIWQLILRYQIGGSDEKTVKIALKKLLLIWLQHVIPEQNIQNLTKDWNSGVALCNLVNVLQPGLCPEYNHLDRDTPLENARRGMELAEEHLGIPQIISAENMVSEHVDELSMMTYLSYFTQDNGVGELWTLNLVNNWNADLGVRNFNTDWNDGSALGKLVNTFAPDQFPAPPSLDNEENCRHGMNTAENSLSIPQIISSSEMANPNIPELAIMAYIVQFSKVKPVKRASDNISVSGGGIADPQVGAVNEFYVRCEDESLNMDDLFVEVIGPNMSPLKLDCEENNPSLRTYRYTAEEPGIYRTTVTYLGDPVPRSPFTSNARQDLNTIRVHGEGLGGGQLHTEVEFTVDVGTTNSRVEARIEGPNGRLVENNVINNGDGTYTVKYTPEEVGNHQISLSINNQKLPGGPIETMVVDPDSVTVSSQQYEEDKQLYAELNERIGIAVDTSSSGEGSLTAQTVGPHDNRVESDIEQEGANQYTVSFTPTEIGEYQTNVYWSGKPIQGCPFVVWVSDPSKVEARGASLYQSQIHDESAFEVTAHGAGPGNVTGYAEHHGNQTLLTVMRKDDDTFECGFRPSDVGEHMVHVHYNNVPIYGSPYRVMIGNPRRVFIKETVTTTTTTVVRTNDRHTLDIDIDTGAGEGDLTCTVQGPDGEVPSEIKNVTDSQRQIMFVPEVPGRYHVNVNYAGAPVDGSPYVVNVAGPPEEIVPVVEVVQHTAPLVKPNMVYVTGKGTAKALSNEQTQVDVDTTLAGEGGLLSATMKDSNHQDIIVSVNDHKDGNYHLTYTAPHPGEYNLNVYLDDQHVQGSPFHINVEGNPNQDILVQGDGIKEGTAGQPVLFTLDGRKVGPGQLSCRCRAPSGKMTYVLISDNKDGTYTVDLNATEPGLHAVDVDWDDKPIPGSPFLVRIMQAPDAGKVRAHGPGLHSSTLADANGNFNIETRGAGPGSLKVRIHGPKGAFKVQMSKSTTSERTLEVQYTPSERGIYTANVLWSEVPIPGSPFEIFIADNENDLKNWRENRQQMHEQVGLSNGY